MAEVPAITTKTVEHAAFKVALKLIEDCHASFSSEEEPLRAKLFGVSGVGKTTALQRYRADFPSIRTASGITVPVLYAAVPAAPTPKSLTTALLKALNADDPDYGKANDQLDRFLKLSETCKIELLLIDEIQHLVDRGRTKSHTAAADRLKELVDGFKRPVVLGGAPRASSLFKINNQLRNRFMASTRLRPFTIDPAGRPAYLAFVKTAAMDLPTPVQELVFAAGFADRLFFATDGLPKQIVEFLRHLRNACLAGDPAELATASKVFRRWFWSDAADDTDPFSLAFAARRLTKPDEPYEPGLQDGDNHA